MAYKSNFFKQGKQNSAAGASGLGELKEKSLEGKTELYERATPDQTRIPGSAGQTDSTSPAVPRNDTQGVGTGQTLMERATSGIPSVTEKRNFSTYQKRLNDYWEEINSQTFVPQEPEKSNFAKRQYLVADYLKKQEESMSSAGIQAQLDSVNQQIDTLMKQERVWQDAQYSKSVGMEYLGGDVPEASVQEQIDQLVAQRGNLESQIEFAKTREWEEQQKAQILDAGGEELLAKLREFDRFKKGKSEITGEEARAILDGLWEKGYSEDQIMEMVDFAARLNSEEEYDAAVEKSAQFASEHPVLSSLGSVAGSLTSGFGMIDAADQNLRNLLSGKETPVNYKTVLMEPSGATNAIRGQVASDIEKNTAGWVGSDTPLGNLYSDFYQLSMSMADSLGAVGLSAMGMPYAGVLLGGSAATNAMTEAKGRGASDAQALTMGLLAGAAETVFEQYSIEKLFSLESPANVKDALMNILKQAIPEASEEFNTTLANTLADMFVMGDKSQYETDKRRYLAQGMTAQEAGKQASVDWVNGIVADTLGGFVSGGLFGMGSNAVNSFQRSGSNTQSFGTDTALHTDQAETPMDRVMLDTFQQLQGQQTDGLEAISQNKPAQAEAGANGRNLPRMTMEDFTNNESPVWNNVDINDEQTKAAITQKVHDSMVAENAVVTIPENTVEQVGEYYPDLRGMKKQERNPILKQKMAELKTSLRQFLNGLKGSSYEFEVNGNILDAKLYDTGIREVLDHITQNKASMLFQSEDVFRNARYLYSTPDYDGTPNIYRWNYFYTPVNVGDEIVGVRIAVRDIAVGQNNIPESQIYNWNIKKDAALGGGKLGKNAASPGTSSAAPVDDTLGGGGGGNPAGRTGASSVSSSAPNVAQTSRNVNGNQGQDGRPMAAPTAWQAESQEQDGVGDMGAKTSEFRHEVKETKSKTLHTLRDKMNVPENQRQTITYDTVSERESMTNARNRLEQDFEGEEAELRAKPSWTDEEMDMGAMIQTKYRIEAMQTGDFSKYQEWERVFNAHKSEAGRSMHALRKYARQNGDSIVSNAARILDEAKTAGLLKAGTDENEVLMLVSGLAEQFDEATGNTDTENLLKLIRDTSAVRRTGSFLHNKLSKTMNWAMDRIAGYAAQEIESGNYDGENYTFLKEFAAAGIESIAGDYKRASVAKGVNTVRKLSMLSKAATVMRNLAANNVFDPVDSFARNISVPLDMLLSKFTGTRSVAWDSSWFSDAKRKGSMDGLAKAIMEVGLDVNADHSKSKYEKSGNRTFKMNGASNKAVGTVSRLLSTWEKFSGYSLTATDEFQKGGIAAEVQRGVDKLYEKGLIKDDSLRNAGEQEALYRTFQDDTRVARGLSTVRKGLNFGFETGLGDALTPFVQVPANLAVRSVEYSPVGLVNSFKDLTKTMISAKNGKLKAAQQAKAVQGVGRSLTGTGLLVFAAFLSLNGLIRVQNPGGDDEKEDKAAFEKMQGKSGTQWNLSATLRALSGESAAWQDKDVLMSIAFLEPFNSLMTTGALIAEDIQNGEGWEEILKDTAAGTLQSILDLPMMDELRSIQYAWQRSDADNAGGKLVDVGKQIAADYAASFIPNALKGIAQGTDQYQRDLYTQDSIGGRFKDQVYASVPGLRQTLPAKQDPFGRDMENEGGALNFLNANLLPGQITTYKTDDLLDKITDLSELTGQTSVFPKYQAPEKITVDGEAFSLDQSQRREYQQIYGKTEYDTRAALFANEYYQGQDQKTTLKAQSYAEEYATQTAKDSMGVGFEPDSWVQDLAGKSPEEVADAIMLKTFQSLADDKKTYENRYDGIGGLLETGSIDDVIALSLCSESLQDAYYEGPSKAGVTVQQWVDTYSYAVSQAEPNDTESKRAAVVEYANSLNISKEQRTALVNGMYSVMPDIILKDAEAPSDFLLKQGQAGIETIEANMSDYQKGYYETYIKGQNVDMETYLDVWEFKGSARSDYDKDGNVIKSAQEKVIEFIDKNGKTKKDKRNLFLSMGYSEKNLPDQWR